ncbi:MAG TPA: dockerin type I domain-containing protein [Phycisphaerae bacterium]|nr:dockerin type I domain-containing protein [Phycisphaerae bacterium]
MSQGDIEPDGFLTALDLAACIDILFAGSPDVQDAGCPSPRYDIDCDGFSTAIDLAKLIDHLFAGGDGPCDACIWRDATCV